MGGDPASPLLTLEPLIEAVREGVEAAGWELSGLQKTTSHEFVGRWAGDASRSAYLFFHLGEGPDRATVEAFLDETSQGLQGNLSLVVEASRLHGLGDVPSALASVGRVAVAHLPRGYRTPVSLRLRLEDGTRPPGSATAEIRFKLVIPPSALNAGASSVSALATAAVRAFRDILADPELEPLLA